jgi:hypothetical protein
LKRDTPGVKVFGEYVRETGMYYDSANLLPAKDKNEVNRHLLALSLLSLQSRGKKPDQ